MLVGILLITSAILIYKLWPGRSPQPRKPSNTDSEPLSPVRRLTVMGGRVVSGRRSSSRHSIFKRISASFHSTRRNSDASIPSLHTDEDPKLWTRNMSPSELEAQTRLNEKRTLYPIDERGPATEQRETNVKEKKSSMSRIFTRSIPHDSLSFSSWNDYNGHRHVLDELASPIGELPAVPGQKKIATEDKTTMRSFVQSDEEQNSKGDSNGSPVKTPASSETEMGGRSSEERISKPPKALDKWPQSLTFDTQTVKAASISAKPYSAYSSKPTPASSNASTSEHKVPPNDPAVSEALRSDPFRPESSHLRSKSDGAANLPKLSALDDLREHSFDRPASPAPSSRYSSINERQSRTTSRSPSRSRSRSQLARQRSRSRSHRVRKARPAPLTIIPQRDRRHSSKLKAVRSTDDLHEADSTAPPTLRRSITVDLAKPLPRSPDENGKKSPPPFVGANVTNVVSPPFAPGQKGKNRQSTNTLTTSDWSPTLSLVSVRSVKRVPLYPGKQSLRLQDKNKSTTFPMKAVPRPGAQARSPIPSVLQTAKQRAPLAQWPMKPTRRQSIQALDYSMSLAQSKVSEPQTVAPGEPVGSSRLEETTAPTIKLNDEPAGAREYTSLVEETRYSSHPFDKPTTRPPPVVEEPAPPKTAYASLNLESSNNRVITIPTGRRRSSRYSHLFDKALPKPPSESCSSTSPTLHGTSKIFGEEPTQSQIELGHRHRASTDTRLSTDTKRSGELRLSTEHTRRSMERRSIDLRPPTEPRRISSFLPSIPHPHAKRLSSAPEVSNVSPVSTPEKGNARNMSSSVSGLSHLQHSDIRPVSEISPLSSELPSDTLKALGEGEDIRT